MMSKPRKKFSLFECRIWFAPDIGIQPQSIDRNRTLRYDLVPRSTQDAPCDTTSYLGLLRMRPAVRPRTPVYSGCVLRYDLVPRSTQDASCDRRKCRRDACGLLTIHNKGRPEPTLFDNNESELYHPIIGLTKRARPQATPFSYSGLAIPAAETATGCSSITWPRRAGKSCADRRCRQPPPRSWSVRCGRYRSHFRLLAQ